MRELITEKVFNANGIDIKLKRFVNNVFGGDQIIIESSVRDYKISIVKESDHYEVAALFEENGEEIIEIGKYFDLDEDSRDIIKLLMKLMVEFADPYDLLDATFEGGL